MIKNEIINRLETINSYIKNKPEYNAAQHKNESRFIITKMFLRWYFGILLGSFVFCSLYNWTCAYINHAYEFTQETGLKYLEVSTIISLIAATLSSSLGFVIGYYFKGKEEENE